MASLFVAKSRRFLVISMFLTMGLNLVACQRSNDATTPSVNTNPANQVASLQSTDLMIGNGAVAEAGKQVTVHYTGWLYEASAADKHGQQFDSSVSRGTPFSFQLGGGQVIKGWDQGVVGMKIGGHRNLIIPSDLAYGRSGRGPIPPAATLVFDIQLIAVN